MPRIFSFILPLVLLPALGACASHPPEQERLSDDALAAVVQEPGVPRDRLARAIDALFADQDDIGQTRAAIVLRNGRRIAERYAPGVDANTRLLSWSMAKCVTGVMIGQLVSDGRLRLDEGVPIPAWQRPGDPRGEITLRQLLQMRSGLRHTEAGLPAHTSDEVRMLFLDGRDDMAAYAEAQPLEAEPGRKFEYSTATSLILADLAARVLSGSGDASTRRKAVSEYLHTRLFEPARMNSAMAEFDAAGTLIGGSMIHATARDWVRFGEFLLNKGAVKGAQIVPVSWITFMTRPSPRNPAYGAHVWLNRRRSQDEPPLFADAPGSVIACQGHLGQYIIVSPSQNLVVVRLGHTPDRKRPELEARLGKLVSIFRKHR